MLADGYHNQFWVDSTRGIIMARGIYGQLIYIDESRQLAAVKLSSWPDYRIPRILSETLDMVPSVAAEFLY